MSPACTLALPGPRGRNFTRTSAVALVFLAGLLPAGCSSEESSPATDSSLLQLVNQKKLSRLLAEQLDHYEASGVVHQQGLLYVVFDNTTAIGIVNATLSNAQLVGGAATGSQGEGITVAGVDNPQLSVVQEGELRGKLSNFGLDGTYKGTASTDVVFGNSNTGFEGVAWLRSAGVDYLLALCEGNLCEESSQGGNGRVKALALEGDTWVTKSTLSVPSSAKFADYSDIALFDKQDGTYLAAIVSQQSSSLWIGNLTTAPFELQGPGKVYGFPKNEDGQEEYCTVEGVTFLDSNTLALVSDRWTGEERCSATDESIHLFKIP